MWISCDPDERTIPALAERFGDWFMWASDFPQPTTRRSTSTISTSRLRRFPQRHDRFLGDNARDLFGIVR